MARNKYREKTLFLRFDVKSTLSKGRLEVNKFAMISEVKDCFIENCIRSYKSGDNVTTDQQLLRSKTRFSFTEFMTFKSDKNGQKYWIVVHLETKYVLNAFRYLRKNES